MKFLKIKLLTGRVSDKGSSAPGDSITLPLKEAVKLIKSEQAEPVVKKHYLNAISAIDKEVKMEAEKQAEINSIANKERLEDDLRELYTHVALKVAQIEGVVLSQEEIDAQVDEMLNGTDIKDGNE